MISLWSNPRSLKALSWAYRLRRHLRRRSPSVLRADRQRALFYQRAWTEAAEELGARIESLGDDILEFQIEDRRTRVRCNWTALDDPVALILAGVKPAVYRLLAGAGLPIARYAEFTLDQIGRAMALLDQTGGPCVVKPAKHTGSGSGVTTNLTRQSQLARAAAAAAIYGPELLIEEQVSGDNYRLLYLDGLLLDAVVRRPPSVLGDGRSTVLDLVQRVNAQRIARGFAGAQVLVACDAEMRRTLASQGLGLRSVPKAGARVVLKTVINENAADENESAAHLLCDAVIEVGARAAEAVGVRLAGIDVITPDPTRPLAEAGGVILEVNTTPGFYYHYHKRDGRCAVALHVLKSIFQAHSSGVERCCQA